MYMYMYVDVYIYIYVYVYVYVYLDMAHASSYVFGSKSGTVPKMFVPYISCFFWG